MAWFNFLINEKEVRSILNSEEIDLRGLLLLKIEYLPGNKILLEFFQKNIPKNIPDRWHQKNIVGLKLCFESEVKNFKLDAKKNFHEMPDLAIEINSELFRVKDDFENFDLIMSPFFLKLKIHPVETLNFL